MFLSVLATGAIITQVIKGFCWEHAVTLIVVTVAAFTSVGGLGGTFYVAFCSCVIMYFLAIVIVLKLMFFSVDELGNRRFSIILSLLTKVFRHWIALENNNKNL